ncbi:ankyrin repeat-containing domain protein [Xylaria longipes]|nr:ankyrin repeat-containing domain protein [Xylaria longipes]
MTSLQIATASGNEHIVRCLLQEGRDPNVAETSLGTPLCIAVYGGSHSMLELLLDHGARIEQLSLGGETAPHIALKNYSIEILELLQRGGDCNCQDPNGETLLRYATRVQSIEAAHLLLENGADPNVMVKLKRKPSVPSSGSATGSKDDSSTNSLVQMKILFTPVPIGAQSDEAEVTHSPISWAMVEGYEGSLQLLLSACDHVIWEDPSHKGECLLHCAVRLKNDQIFRILLERGPKELHHSRNSMGDIPLHTAAEVGNVAAATMLVNVGCQIDHRNRIKSTPLTTAIFNGHLEIANLLIKHWADLSIADEFGCGQLYCIRDARLQDLVAELNSRWMQTLVAMRRELGRLCLQALVIYVLFYVYSSIYTSR